jgi:hypothetical protein
VWEYVVPPLKGSGVFGDAGPDGDPFIDEGDRFRRIVRRDDIADCFQVPDRLRA